MRPKRGGIAAPQQRNRNSRCRMSVILLLAVSVIAPLIFLAGRASHFTTALATRRNDFLDWQSTLNNADGFRSLKGLKQIQKLLPEEVGQVLNVFASKNDDNEQFNLTLVGAKTLSSSLVKENSLDISRENLSRENYTQRNVSTEDKPKANMLQQEGIQTEESANQSSKFLDLAEVENSKEEKFSNQLKHSDVSKRALDEITLQQEMEGQTNVNLTQDQSSLLSLKPTEHVSQDRLRMNVMESDADPKQLDFIKSSSGLDTTKSTRHAHRHSSHQIRKEKRSAPSQHLIVKQEKHKSLDSQIKHLRELLTKAKIFAALAHAHKNNALLRDMRFVVRDCQDVLSDATVDTQLPSSVPERVKLMEYILTKAEKQPYKCVDMVEKMKALLHLEEETSRSLRKENLILSQLAAKTVPKGLHCLSMRLNVEYYLLPSHEQHFSNQGNLENSSLYHYALFSDNVLAAAVVVNSTVYHAEDPEKHVFHIVTDRLNYGSMKMWFLMNPPGNATIHIENIDSFKWLNSSYCPVLRQLDSATMKEYYFKANQPDHLAPGLKYRNPKYLSMLNHLRFYLPHIYPTLDKILFLDDDIVVQKDLTPLWNIDMHGKVNGAVETCGSSFHRFDKYLNFSNPLISKQFDPNACGWAYGMNMFDLQQWKRKDITGIYHRWQEKNEDRTLWKLGTLPAGLLTFYNLTFVLDKNWHVLGLGYSPLVTSKEIEKAAVIHYNGNLKPWLEIGMEKYKPYWRRHLNPYQPFLQQCNVNL